MRPLLLVAVVAAAGCGAVEAPELDRAPASAEGAGLTTFRDDARGLEVTFPSRWQRARRRLTPGLTNPREILSLGTVAPVVNRRAPCAQFPIATLRRVGPSDVFLTLQERTGRSADRYPRPRRFSLHGSDTSEIEACLREPAPFRAYWLAFDDRGRSFYALVAIGTEAGPEREEEVLAVLDSLRLHRRPATGRDRAVVDDRQRGIWLEHPRDWRLYPFRLTEVVEPRHQVALGTFALEQRRPDPNCAPRTATRARPRGGGMLIVFEYRRLNPTQMARFPQRPRRFHAGPRRAYECFGDSILIRWREHGRAFQAHLYGPRRRIRQALSILDSWRTTPFQG